MEKPKYINEYRKFGNVFKGGRFNEKGFIDRLVLQVFISLIIVAITLFINNINTAFTQTLTQGIKSTISWNIDFAKTIDTFMNIKDIVPNTKKNLGIGATDTNTSEFIMPVEGTITSEFGERIHPVFKTVSMHNGIDIDAALGTPIKAAQAGKVIKVGEDEINGKYLKIENGIYQTAYAHCQKITVKEGQSVEQGEILGETGETGLVSGPHLHFEILENGIPVNPTEKFK